MNSRRGEGPCPRMVRNPKARGSRSRSNFDENLSNNSRRSTRTRTLAFVLFAGANCSLKASDLLAYDEVTVKNGLNGNTCQLYLQITIISVRHQKLGTFLWASRRREPYASQVLRFPVQAPSYGPLWRQNGDTFDRRFLYIVQARSGSIFRRSSINPESLRDTNWTRKDTKSFKFQSERHSSSKKCSITKYSRVLSGFL
ncbi:hypothetical protein BJ138DRAFT_218755 [Hygrophoropsis aurantiaca]|uniref:Uncharacterized protein n=1 Tax=Hygrophoropsis aurantiaca TaxID=72124 RepID=A0ACB8A8V0_9AGAM|nr:hypothetical protein BJ138DRAFT_218755 [Hygrophoropsis aurantiaca]